MAEALYLRKSLRDHVRSAGPDSGVGRFCEKCLVAWPCYSFRVAEGRERRTRAARYAFERTSGDLDAVAVAWNHANEHTDWYPDDLTYFPPALLRTSVGHHVGGYRGRTVSYGLRHGQEDMEW